MCLCITSRFLQRCGPLQQSGWHAEWRRAKRILGRIRRRRRRWRGGAGGVTCNTDDACSCSSAGSQVNRRCILIRSADRQRRCCPFIKARNTCIHESPPKIIESLLSICMLQFLRALTVLAASLPNGIEFSIENVILGHLAERCGILKRIPLAQLLADTGLTGSFAAPRVHRLFDAGHGGCR